MEQYIGEISRYLTMENFIYFMIVSFVLTVMIYLIKQASKLIALILVCGGIYYFWFAPQSFKTSVNKCVKVSYSKKSIDNSCKRIFR